MGRLPFLLLFLLLARVKKKAQRNQKTSPLALDIRIYTAKIAGSNPAEPIVLFSSARLYNRPYESHA
jgi:hypothetical protein